MIERQMENIEVSISKAGKLRIAQSGATSEDEVVILVHPAQVETLIQWLKETKEEIEQAVVAGDLPEVDETGRHPAQLQ